MEGLEPRHLFAAYNFSVIGQFPTDGSLGTSPSNAVTVDAAGNVFGESTYGGSTDDGTIWEIPAATGTLRTLVAFNGANGAQPEGGMILDSAGNLYGTTNAGGSDNFGTVFEIKTGTAAITTIANFSETASGEGFGNPTGGVVMDSSGDLFGIGPIGAANSSGEGTQNGAAFEIRAGSHTITKLASFDINTAGADDYGSPALDTAGNLFGATELGGANGFGAVWEYKPRATALTVVDSFTKQTGIDPQTSVVFDSAGNLFGTATLYGGGDGGFGSVWEVAAGTSQITLRAALDNSAALGSAPYGALAVDAAGDVFFGASSSPSPGGGTVLELPANSNTLQSIHILETATDGGQFAGGVTLAADGSLYGATNTGNTDANGSGTVFRLTPGSPPEFLKFASVPSNFPANSAAGTFAVNIVDATGGIVPTDESTLTISIASGPTGGAITGSTTVTAVNGVAAFDGLSFTQPGTYTLTVVNGSLAAAVSSPFVVTSPAANGNVVPTITGVTLPSTVVPGDSGTLIVQLSNSGNLPAKGIVHGVLTLTSDDSSVDGVAAIAAALNHLSVSLAAGASRVYRVKFTVPLGLAAGTYNAVLSLTATSGFAGSSVSTSPIVSDATFAVVSSFGTLPGRRGAKFITSNSSGGRVTFALTGPGSGTITTAADGSNSLSLTGTTAASRVVVTSAGQGAVPLVGITADAAVGVISAAAVQLTGDLTLPGGVKTLTLGSITGAAVTAASITTMTVNGTLNANVATAAIGTLSVRGDVVDSAVLVGANFGADGVLGGGDDAFGVGSINVLKVTGSISNNSVIAAGLNLTGGGLPVTAADTLLGGGRIGSIVIGGDLAGGSYVLAATFPAKARVAGSIATGGAAFQLPA